MDSWVPTGMVSRRPDRAFGGGHADAPVALAAEDLGAFAGGVAQLHQHGPGGGDEPVLAGGGGQLHQAAAQHEPALDVAADQPVVDQRQGQPVHGGPGQPGGGHQLRQGGGAGLECVEHMGRFIDDADSTRIVHVMILPSHYLRCKSMTLAYSRPVLIQWMGRRTITAVKGDGRGKTLAEKVWDAHVVRKGDGEGATPSRTCSTSTCTWCTR